MWNLKKPFSLIAKVPRALKQKRKRRQRKTALLVGVEYTGNGHHHQLDATHGDVSTMKSLLMNKYLYKESDITVLIDDDEPADAPTKENIIQAMNKLVSGTKAGDQLFFHFSGHGSQTPCAAADKSEDDGMDEAIIPCDATGDKDTWITDNEMNEILVNGLPVGAQLIAIFDMCHSGTALDLKHYKCHEELEGISRNGSASQAGPSAPRSTDAQASSKHGVEIPLSWASFNACGRKSHQEVEKEKVVLRELPESAMDGQAEKGNRWYPLKARKSTMRSELSPISETSPKVRSGSSGSQIGGAAAVSSGVRNCSKCDGSQSERDAGERWPPGIVSATIFKPTYLPRAFTEDSISHILEALLKGSRILENESTLQAGPSTPRTNAQDSWNYEVATSGSRSSVLVCKRKSPEEVEMKKTTVVELPPENDTDDQTKRGNRRYSLRVRQDVIRSKLSSKSETGPKAQRGSGNSQNIGPRLASSDYRQISVGATRDEQSTFESEKTVTSVLVEIAEKDMYPMYDPLTSMKIWMNGISGGVCKIPNMNLILRMLLQVLVVLCCCAVVVHLTHAMHSLPTLQLVFRADTPVAYSGSSCGY